MKLILSYILIIVAMFSVSFAADCDFKGHQFNIGESYAPPGQCMKITCTGKNAISGLGCAESAAPDSCKYIKQDNSKPYPQCCPRYEC